MQFSLSCDAVGLTPSINGHAVMARIMFLSVRQFNHPRWTNLGTFLARSFVPAIEKTRIGSKKKEWAGGLLVVCVVLAGCFGIEVLQQI
jgi:hypothetical protein